MRRMILCALFILFLLLYPTPYTLYPVSAQSAGSCASTGTSSVRVQSGLVSSPLVQQNLVNESGFCIIDPKAAFAPYKVPTYDDLKSLYFDQAKPRSNLVKTSLNGNKDQDNIPLTDAGNEYLYYINGDLTISSNIPGNQTGIVFVSGNLFINPSSGRLTVDVNSGLVFVAKGNVNISQSVDRVDAVIISDGIICTAYDGASCPAVNVSTSQLVINGSLISLNAAAPIKFRRALADNSQPAEKINHQVKYLVILRNLLADTFQRWSEIP